MPAPAAPSPAAWTGLDPAQKRERVLAAAERVFAERGLEAPMPAVARAAGAGVGSLYRQFPSKQALVAALAIRRLAALEAEAAAVRDGDPWQGLVRLVWRALGDDARDDVAAQAIASASDDADVRAARERVRAHIAVLLDRARAAGQVRADATTDDLGLVIGAARATSRAQPDAGRRLVVLALDGLAGQGSPTGVAGYQKGTGTC